MFKWAGGKDDAFFARLSKNAISVYQAPEMGLLDKRSIKLEGIQEFQWSPSEPLIAAYTTEQGNLPARVVLIKVPERTEVRQKNLFSVSGECGERSHPSRRGGTKGLWWPQHHASLHRVEGSMAPPIKEPLRHAALIYDVSPPLPDIKMYWHPQGDYLAAKVERFTKTKKSTYTGFELFSIRDKDIPMEVCAWRWTCCQ